MTAAPRRWERSGRALALGLLLAPGMPWGAASAAADAAAQGQAQAPAAPPAPTAPAAPATSTAALPASEWRVTEEHWYVLSLDGQPCGWMRSEEAASADGSRRRQVSESLMRLSRGGQPVEVEVRSAFEETPRGQPIRCEVRQRSGDQPIEQWFLFDPATPERIRVGARQGGREKIDTMPAPPPGWLAPMAAEAFAQERRSAGAREFRVRTVEPQSGMREMEVVNTLLGESTFQLGDRTVPVTRWKVQNSLVPLPTEEEWSGDGVLVRSRTTMALGVVEAVLSGRQQALAAGRGAAPVELMARTLVKPDRSIPGFLRLREAVFRVRGRDGSLADLPSCGAQRVSRVDAGTMDVEVRVDAPAEATAAELADERYRRPSVVIDSDDAQVKALAERALSGVPEAAPALARAEALRRAVAAHVTRKDLRSAFASASETVRSHEGDCTEHAVLLAALLRSSGIPSRVATGLVYADRFAGQRDIFAWHMWTQALFDGRWVDLDATLPASGPRHHAAHLCTGTSAQEQGSMDVEWAALAGMIGNLQVEVLRLDGEGAKGTP